MLNLFNKDDKIDGHKKRFTYLMDFNILLYTGGKFLTKNNIDRKIDK